MDSNQTITWWMELSDTSKDGWLEDSWIGNLLPFENHWAFHERLEWIYMKSDKTGGFWIWQKVTGWIWTNPDCWPFVWSRYSQLVVPHPSKIGFSFTTTHPAAWVDYSA